MDIVVTAHEAHGTWIVTCSTCGMLCVADEWAVEKVATRHMGSHDLVAA